MKKNNYKKKNLNNKKRPLIGIIGGKGRMGNWFKMFFEKEGLEVIISDKDTSLSNFELAQKSDIIIVSVPIKKSVQVIKEVRGCVKKDALLADFTSLKLKQTEALKKTNGGSLGMHPLFGPLVLDLNNQTIVFCRVKDNYWVKFLQNLFLKRGAKIIEISPREHDRQMAMIQALIHFTNISTARTLYAQKIDSKSPLLTPVFRLQSLIIGRILNQNPRLYAELEIENPYFKKILNEFEKQSKLLSADIKKKNFKGFIKKFVQTASYLEGFREIAQTKSNEVLKTLEHQPIKIKELKTKISLKEKKCKVGFLGPEGTFSHQAVLSVFPQEKNISSFLTIKGIFEAVNNGEIEVGIVPAENSTNGMVTETINKLIEYPLKVSGSFNHRIHHCLLARTKNIKDIKIIKSHPQALGQCRHWIELHFPKINIESISSTTSAILENNDSKVAFIASRAAAKIYDLKILAENIEDVKENFTKFYLVSSDLNEYFVKKLKAKRTLILYAVYDRIGILKDVLDVFAKNNINLTSLHSIPSHLKPWDYYFFQEIEVPYSSPILQKTIKEVNKYCPVIRVLGAS